MYGNDFRGMAAKARTLLLAAGLLLALAGGAFGQSPDAATPDLAAHLWATTLDKLAIDQPSYAGYRRALEK